MLCGSFCRLHHPNRIHVDPPPDFPFAPHATPEFDPELTFPPSSSIRIVKSIMHRELNSYPTTVYRARLAAIKRAGKARVYTRRVLIFEERR